MTITPVRGGVSSGRTFECVRHRGLIPGPESSSKDGAETMSGLKARLDQSKEARIHNIDYRTLRRARQRPEEALIGHATLVCGDGDTSWTCNEYTIMVRICGAGGELGGWETWVFSTCSRLIDLSMQKLACSLAV